MSIIVAAAGLYLISKTGPVFLRVVGLILLLSALVAAAYVVLAMLIGVAAFAFGRGFIRARREQNGAGTL